MKIAFCTLGCKANQFDTQALEQLASSRGHYIVPFDGPADIYVINTCTVTAQSDHKSRQMIRRARRRSADAVVAVCGCFSQVSPDAASQLGADVVAGSRDRAAFIELIEKAYAVRGKQIFSVNRYRPGVLFENLPGGGYEGRTRALLKIEDGCDNYCAYCIIPYSRGHVRSMPVSDAAYEIKKLWANGFRETVITGIEISSYGNDLSGVGLIDAIDAMCRAAPEMRIHLGSLEPRTITREFCLRASEHDNLVRHFHLSLQSGCDETLKRMRRRYDTAGFYNSVKLLNEFFPNCGITADLITGFPGEDEVEFSKTLEFIKKCRFSAMHVFPYSQRPGTPAADMPQIPMAIREERAHRASETAARMKRDFMSRQIGTSRSVLFEEPRGEAQYGHTENYLPVRAECSDNLKGKVRNVRIYAAGENRLLGKCM